MRQKICQKISVIKTNSFDWELLTFDHIEKIVHFGILIHVYVKTFGKIETDGNHPISSLICPMVEAGTLGQRLVNCHILLVFKFKTPNPFNANLQTLVPSTK